MSAFFRGKCRWRVWQTQTQITCLRQPARPNAVRPYHRALRDDGPRTNDNFVGPLFWGVTPENSIITDRIHEAFAQTFTFHRPLCPGACHSGRRRMAALALAGQPSRSGWHDCRTRARGTRHGPSRRARGSSHPRPIPCGRSFRARLRNRSGPPLANGPEPQKCRGGAFRKSLAIALFQWTSKAEPWACPKWLRQHLRSFPEEQRRLLDSYTRGVNAFIESHRGRLPVEFLLQYQPEPWREIDSVAVALNLASALSQSWGRDLVRERMAPGLPKSCSQTCSLTSRRSMCPWLDVAPRRNSASPRT